MTASSFRGGDTAVTNVPPMASLVPHAGAMCLLDRVIDWDEDGIRCEATVADRHPLKVGTRLPATALIEYAAQAMAAHGRLIALAEAADQAGADGANDGRPRPGPRPGRLVGLRGIDLGVRWVDHRRLQVLVRRLGGDSANVLYGFEVLGTDGTDDTRLASGRAFVTLVPTR